MAILLGIFEEGLIYAIMALGVYITYKLLDIADLTVDGSICTGAAVCTMMLLSGRSLWLAVLCAVVLVFWMGNLSTPVTAEEPSTVEAGWLGGMNGVKLEALT